MGKSHSQIFGKRAIDIIVAASGIAISSLLILAISIMIFIESGLPIIIHQRVGRGGRFFNCLKFRTMVQNQEQVLQDYLAKNPDAAKEWNETHKLKNDPRITKVGRLLRKTSLDELPQLFNVLKGDMSIVGPRPIVAQEAEKYGSNFLHYASVKPGITGLWQVSGRNDLSYEKRVEIDSYYARNWSIIGDIAIMLKTIPAVLLQKGAY